MVSLAIGPAELAGNGHWKPSVCELEKFALGPIALQINSFLHADV